MTHLEPIKARYLKDAPTVRLGGLAADLARLSSRCQNPKNEAVVLSLLEEGKFFAEWAAPDADPDAQALLAEIQIQLACWQRVWPRIASAPDRLKSISEESRRWSDLLLQRSGLLNK